MVIHLFRSWHSGHWQAGARHTQEEYETQIGWQQLESSLFRIWLVNHNLTTVTQFYSPTQLRFNSTYRNREVFFWFFISFWQLPNMDLPSSSCNSDLLPGIESFHKDVPEAYPGDQLGVLLKGLQKDSHGGVKRGVCLVPEASPIKASNHFKAKVANHFTLLTG